MIFSPPFLALALIDGAPSLWAVDATVLACVFLAGAALMLWFRDRGWHWAGGLIAALAFGYGASMAWRIQHIGQVLSLAYLAVAMLCLDRALARGSILYGVAAGVVAACMVLGRDQVALLGIYLLAGLVVWRLLTAAEPRAALRASALPLAAGGVCAALLIAVPVLLTALLVGRVQPPLDRLHRRRARLAASGPAADAGDARRVRRLGPHGGLLGPAELRLAGLRHLPRPEHGRAVHRRAAAPAADLGRRARAAVGARDPLLHLRRRRGPGLCARLVHAGVPRALRGSAGRGPLPPPGGRDVPDRRAGRDPRGLRRAPAADRAPRGFRAPDRDRRRRDSRARVRARRPAWGSGSAACRGFRCQWLRRSSRLPPRRLR